jgi:hypothetical protein
MGLFFWTASSSQNSYSSFSLVPSGTALPGDYDKASTKEVLFNSPLDSHCQTIPGTSVKALGFCFGMSLSNRFRQVWRSFSFHPRVSSLPRAQNWTANLSHCSRPRCGQEYSALLRKSSCNHWPSPWFLTCQSQECSKMCWTCDWLPAFPSCNDVCNFEMGHWTLVRISWFYHIRQGVGDPWPNDDFS